MTPPLSRTVSTCPFLFCRFGSRRSCDSSAFRSSARLPCPDAGWTSFVTLLPFAPPAFQQASSLIWLLLTSCLLSQARSPRVRTCTFEPCRQTLPNVSFGDGRISRFLARLSPTFGLSVCFCSCGRLFATPFFQLGLAASTLGFATLVVTACGYLLSDNEYMPMSGTLGRKSEAPSAADNWPDYLFRTGRHKHATESASLFRPTALIYSLHMETGWRLSENACLAALRIHVFAHLRDFSANECKDEAIVVVVFPPIKQRGLHPLLNDDRLAIAVKSSKVY